VTTAAETFLRKSIPPSMRGPAWDLAIGVVGTSEQANWDLAQDIEDQLFEATAAGKYLDRLGSRSGVRRPQGVGMTDEDFRALLVAINASQLTPDAMFALLEVFYGLDATHASVTSGTSGPFSITDQSTLTFRFDGKRPVTVVFSASDYPAGTGRTLEVAAAINRAFAQNDINALALPYLDPAGGVNLFLRVYTGTPGLDGSAEVLGGTAQPSFSFLTALASTANESWDVTRNGSRTRYWYTGATNWSGVVNPGDVVDIGGGTFNAANKGEFTVAAVYKTSGRNLQPNGGFEQFTGAVADGYAAYNNSGGLEPTTLSIVAGRTGGSAQRVSWAVNNTSTKGIRSLGGDQQGIAGGWKPGHSYLVTFWSKGSGTVIGSTFTLGWNTFPAVTWLQDPPVSGAYQQYQAKVVLSPTTNPEMQPPGGLYITVGIGVQGSLDFDDLSVTDIGPWFEVENISGVAQTAVTGSSVAFTRPRKNMLRDQPIAAYITQTGVSNFDAVLPATAGAVTREPGEAAYLRGRSGAPVTAAKVSGDRQTMTLTSALHGLSVGDQVILDGLLPGANPYSASGGALNGVFAVKSVVDANNFTVVPPSGPLFNMVAPAPNTQTGVTAAANAAVAPDGTLTAYRLAYDGSGAADALRVNWTNNSAQLTGVEFLAGVWLRADAPLTLKLSNNAQAPIITINVTSQWQYFSTAGVASNSVTFIQVKIFQASGDNTACQFYAWGPVGAATTNLAVTSGTTFTPIKAQDAPIGPPAPIDAIIYDPVAGLKVTESKTTTTASLDPRRSYQLLNVTDATQFPDAPGWLVIGLGYSYQAAPVQYFGRSGSGLLMLDPSYVFAAAVPAGANVNLLSGPTPGEPAHPEAGASYLTSSPAGRLSAEDLIAKLAAAGIEVFVDVKYPGDRGLAGEGLPTNGQARLGGVVDAFAGDTADDEVAAARAAI
jgi:hypothetical protein